jgi:hypothetical protein
VDKVGVGRELQTETLNIEVAMILRKAELRDQVRAHDIGIEQSHGSVAPLEESDEQDVRVVDLPAPGEAVKKKTVTS